MMDSNKSKMGRLFCELGLEELPNTEHDKPFKACLNCDHLIYASCPAFKIRWKVPRDDVCEWINMEYNASLPKYDSLLETKIEKE